MAFLALRLIALLSYPLFRCNNLRLTLGILASENHLILRIFIFRKSHQIAFSSIGNERQGGIVAEYERETLHIEILGVSIIIEGGKRFFGVEFLHQKHISLVFVHQVEGSGVESAVFEHSQHLVFGIELSQILSAFLIIELLDVGVVPNILACYGGNAFCL